MFLLLQKTLPLSYHLHTIPRYRFSEPMMAWPIWTTVQSKPLSIDVECAEFGDHGQPTPRHGAYQTGASTQKCAVSGASIACTSQTSAEIGAQRVPGTSEHLHIFQEGSPRSASRIAGHRRVINDLDTRHLSP